MHQNKPGLLLNPFVELGLLVTFQCFLISFAGTLTIQERFEGQNLVATISVPLITLSLGAAYLLISARNNRKHLGSFLFPAKLIWILYVVLNFLPILMGWYLLGPIYAGMAFWIFVSLFLYRWKIQQWPLAGNLLFSLLMMMSILVLRFVIADLQYPILMFFAFFTFLISFVFKWFEDVYTAHSDRLKGRESLANLLSPSRRNLWSQILLIFFLSLLLVYLNFLRQYFFGPMEWIFLSYFAFCLLVPSGMLLFRLSKEQASTFETDVLNTLAYVRLTGVFAVLLF